MSFKGVAEASASEDLDTAESSSIEAHEQQGAEPEIMRNAWEKH